MNNPIKELIKKWKTRLKLWLIGLTILLLIDEYIKEGYLFKIEDVWNTNITHEKIILLLVIILGIIALKRK